MTKHDAIRYLAIIPIPLCYWFFGEVVFPLGKSLSPPDQMGELPRLSELCFQLAAIKNGVVAHCIIGIIISAILITISRLKRLVVFFPLVLTMAWTITFFYVALYLVGLVLPYYHMNLYLK